MASSTGKSISNLLEDALDLIGKEDSLDANGSAQISAAKQLLAERSKVKRGIESSDFVPFNASKPVAPENPFMNQISGSTVDDPKYWKTAGAGKKGGPVKAAKSMKFASGSTNQNKAAKKRTAKGEQYNDRYLAKKESVSMLSQKRKVLKS